MKKLNKNEILRIHLALHNGSESVNIQDRNLAIFKRPSGCKALLVNDMEFIEQRKDTHSIYSERAKSGEKISWGRWPNDLSKSWIKIAGTTIEIPKHYHEEEKTEETQETTSNA